MKVIATLRARLPVYTAAFDRHHTDLGSIVRA